jgi:hypothetical protein
MSPHAIVPHTRIDNAIIDNLAAQIGIYGLGIYVAIKRHLNTKTGDCFPSYRTIAKKLHIDRGTVIRYVKKLKAFNVLDPQLRFKEDGSPTSNQYNFSPSAENSSGSGGSGAKQPEVVVADNHPGCTEPPEQVPTPNKKQRSISDVDFNSTNSPQTPDKSPINSHIFPSKEQLEPTEKQKTCTHPTEFIVILPDDITICNHCYGLLDVNLNLQEEKTPIQSGETPPVEIFAA